MKKIVDTIAPERGDVIFEIGPGHGELTIPLVQKCSELNCRIIAIEKDAVLAETLAKSPIGKDIEIVREDVLQFLPNIMEKKYKIVGNIPYYLTGHLLRAISELPEKPARCVFMLQKEVAERIIAAPQRMNRLAASVQFWAEPKVVGRVPKENFSPKPKVDSAIVLFEVKKSISPLDSSRYYTALRGIYAQPRKTLLNNIAAAKKSSPRDNSKEYISHTLQNIGIIPESRPQNLAIEDIIRIAEVLF